MIRAVIADSVLRREGVARLLEDAGFALVVRAGDGDDLLRRVRAHKPDGFHPSSAGGRRTDP
jgi:DNA-binding NarL/FixJ family response regulator